METWWGTAGERHTHTHVHTHTVICFNYNGEGILSWINDICDHKTTIKGTFLAEIIISWFLCLAVFQKSVWQWLRKADRAKTARKRIRSKSATVPSDTRGSPARWVHKCVWQQHKTTQQSFSWIKIQVWREKTFLSKCPDENWDKHLPIFVGF